VIGRQPGCRNAKVLLKTGYGDRLEALYVLGLTAGLRQAELLGIRWEHIDLERGTLQVHRTLTRSKNGNPSSVTPWPPRGSGA